MSDFNKLFNKMETERSKVPNALLEDYMPVFVVNYLRDQLGLDNKDNTHSGSDQGLVHLFRERNNKDSEWEDHSFFEDNPNFEGEFLLSQERLNHVGIILRFAKEVMENFFIDNHRLVQHFFDEIAYPCVELLYHFEVTYGLLQVNGYMLRLARVKELDMTRVDHFKKHFLSFCFSSHAFSFENRDRSIPILEVFIKRIILTHYCNPCNKPELVDVRLITGEILEKLVMKLICDDSMKLNSTNQSILLSVLVDVNVTSSVKRRFFIEHMKVILQAGSKPFLTPEEIYQRQETIADPAKLVVLENFRLTVSEVIRSIFNAEDVMAIISSSLSFSEANWESLLTFVSVWIQEKAKGATTLLKDFIKSLIREGLGNKCDAKVMTGFILARHCSLVASETFSRYEKWFSNTFESESYSPANDAQSFEYLTKLLSEWVPLEPCCFLRVHSTFWPFIPKGCRNSWNEYLQLAKTRIAEFSSEEGETKEHVLNLNDPLQHQISTVLKNFESSGKIPDFIHKMFVFRKPEYLNTFLPALLRKPTGVALTDSRLRLIEMLNKEGKIPPDMYARYRESRNKS